MNASIGPVARMPATEAAAERDLPPAVVAMRRIILWELRGPEPRSAYSVPCRWPLARTHVLTAVQVLVAEGLLERVVDPDGTAGYRATAAGRAVTTGWGAGSRTSGPMRPLAGAATAE